MSFSETRVRIYRTVCISMDKFVSQETLNTTVYIRPWLLTLAPSLCLTHCLDNMMVPNLHQMMTIT